MLFFDNFAMKYIYISFKQAFREAGIEKRWIEGEFQSVSFKSWTILITPVHTKSWFIGTFGSRW